MDRKETMAIEAAVRERQEIHRKLDQIIEMLEALQPTAKVRGSRKPKEE